MCSAWPGWRTSDANLQLARWKYSILMILSELFFFPVLFFNMLTYQEQTILLLLLHLSFRWCQLEVIDFISVKWRGPFSVIDQHKESKLIRWRWTREKKNINYLDLTVWWGLTSSPLAALWLQSTLRWHENDPAGEVRGPGVRSTLGSGSPVSHKETGEESCHSLSADHGTDP